MAKRATKGQTETGVGKSPASETAGPVTRYIPLVDWPKYHPWPTVKGLRELVFHEKTNGFSDAVKRVNGRILIDEAAFVRWVGAQDRASRA